MFRIKTTQPRVNRHFNQRKFALSSFEKFRKISFLQQDLISKQINKSNFLINQQQTIKRQLKKIDLNKLQKQNILTLSQKTEKYSHYQQSYKKIRNLSNLLIENLKIYQQCTNTKKKKKLQLSNLVGYNESIERVIFNGNKLRTNLHEKDFLKLFDMCRMQEKNSEKDFNLFIMLNIFNNELQELIEKKSTHYTNVKFKRLELHFNRNKFIKEKFLCNLKNKYLIEELNKINENCSILCQKKPSNLSKLIKNFQNCVGQLKLPPYLMVSEKNIHKLQDLICNKSQI